MLWNILGPSLKRTALSLEEPADTPTVELIRRVKEKFKTRIKPREVARGEAPIYEHTMTGKDIDLTVLPIPRHWPLDGGRYAGTADAVITRDPDNGCRHLPHDGAGSARSRPVSLAGQGRAAAHHAVVAEG
jgi:4-hydroxy-3-polyprenylbenzoate decarboxylase